MCVYLILLLEETRLLVVGVHNADGNGGLCRSGGGSAVHGLDSDDVAVHPLPVDEVAVGDADLTAHRVEAKGGDDRVVSGEAQIADHVVDGRQVGIGGEDLSVNGVVYCGSVYLVRNCK